MPARASQDARPKAKVERADLEAGREAHRRKLGIVQREEVEVGHVDVAHPPVADLGEAVAVQSLPTMHRHLAAALAYAQRLARLPDDRRCGSDPRIEAVARRDADVHFVETVQILGHASHGGG